MIRKKHVCKRIRYTICVHASAAARSRINAFRRDPTVAQPGSTRELSPPRLEIYICICILHNTLLCSATSTCRQTHTRTHAHAPASNRHESGILFTPAAHLFDLFTILRVLYCWRARIVLASQHSIMHILCIAHVCVSQARTHARSPRVCTAPHRAITVNYIYRSIVIVARVHGGPGQSRVRAE